MMSGNEEAVLGRITAVYGVKGWLKVYSYTDPVENILDYRRWTLLLDGRRQAVTVATGKRHGKGLVVQLQGVADRDQAQRYCGAEIAVESAELPALPEGEYYWHQLEGLEVCTIDGVNLGKVDHLIETGANDVLVVHSSRDSIDDRERLIPWLPDQVVTTVDLPANRMTVDWDPEF